MQECKCVLYQNKVMQYNYFLCDMKSMSNTCPNGDRGLDFDVYENSKISLLACI